jgi:hypothetical protein
MTLILNNNLTFDNLIYLNNFENFEIENICNKIISDNIIVSTKSNIIESNEINNFCIVKHSRCINNVYMGFISDISITKIEILEKINDDFEFIILKKYIPIKKTYDIINSDNIHILINNKEYIKYQSNKEIYYFDYISISPYKDIYYKLYFDDSSSSINNNNLYDVGIFCNKDHMIDLIYNLNLL